MGRNPLDTETLWFEMYHRSRDFGRTGAVMAAISAIDIALWDIAGKFLSSQQHQLWAERCAMIFTLLPAFTEFQVRMKLTACRRSDYAFREWPGNEKLNGFGVKDDLVVMQAIAKAMQGKEVELMIDTNHSLAAQKHLS